MTASLAALAVLGGAVAGISLGLLGVGSTILVVPLLVYVMHVPPHLAIGTCAVEATITALWSLAVHARAGTVRWPHGGTYAVASMLGAASGARLGKSTDGHALLALLGALMVVVAALMVRNALRGHSGGAAHERAVLRPRFVLVLLAGTGFGVGAFAGLVGVGGGFMSVPALMFTTGMPLLSAIGSSLVSVAVVAATTAASYAFSHLVEWRIAGLLMIGGVAGAYTGVKLARVLGARKRALTLLFSAVVALAGLYMVAQGLSRVL